MFNIIQAIILTDLAGGDDSQEMFPTQDYHQCPQHIEEQTFFEGSDTLMALAL
jgi:hypothetical protein